MAGSSKRARRRRRVERRRKMRAKASQAEPTTKATLTPAPLDSDGQQQLVTLMTRRGYKPGKATVRQDDTGVHTEASM